MVAEPQAIPWGLSLAWKHGFRQVIGKLYAKVVIDLIKFADVNLHPLGALILDVRELLQRDWNCSLTHTLREGNTCADALAKAGCHMVTDFELIEEPTGDVGEILEADVRGLAEPLIRKK